MKQNTAGQIIGAQLVSATDGSAFTGSASVVVTIDGGTQAAGGGTVTHEGNGWHSYAPTQAETNGAHLAFTFTGSGAIPATVQVYTHFPQTGDSYARLGAPAGASVSADVAAIQSDTNDLQTQIGAAGAGLTALGDARLANLDAAVSTRSTYAGGDTAGTTTLLARLTAGRATALDNLDATISSRLAAAGYTAPDNASIASILAAVDTEVAAIVSAVVAIQAKTDLLAFTSGNVHANLQVAAANSIGDTALTNAAIDELVASVLAGVIEGTVTLKQSLQLSNAAAAGKLSGAATASIALRNLADTMDRIAATVDADGNRTAITRTFE